MFRWLGGTALAVVVLGIVWIVVTGLLARSKLNAAKAEITQLKQAVAHGDVDRAQRIGRRIEEQTAGAHALTSGPAWWMAANLPLVGAPLHTSRVMAAEVDRIGRHALPGVLRLADGVSKAASPQAGTVDLQRIGDAAPALHAAAATTDAATRRIRHLDGSWLPYVADARTSLLSKLSSLSTQLAGADRAVRVILPMLGEQRPQRFFIGFLNEAEARGVGGIPGEFAIATADNGKVHFERFGSDDDLHGVRADVSMAADFTAQFAQDDPTGVFQNSTVSPDFRDAARIWAGMWKKQTGERIDTAIAVDPTALGYLLDVSGPARLAGGEKVNGADVVALTEKDVYARYPDKPARKAYLSAVAKAASEQLLSGGSAGDLARAAARAAGQRRILVWSADPAIESIVLRSGYGGALPGPDAPVTGFVVTNASGGKLDYYLDRVMTYDRSTCGGPAVATFRLTNRAPARLPAYVTIRADAAGARARPGDERLLVTYYGTAGAQVRGVTVDGHALVLAAGRLRGLTTVSLPLEIARGATRTITVRLTEPAAKGALRVLQQPLVRPMTVRTSGPDCG